ncbi:7-cyano-7-deazaguanine synthase [Candidatus Sumerlaeota bacterium]|nr:7-cyano-7-deazaguanine synthase [Candidatus Sumerlaeota bacterium]
MMLPRARPGTVVLMSGGIDSAVMAGMAARAGDIVYPLYVRQGFLWEDEELGAVGRYLAAFNSEDRARVRPLTTIASQAPPTFGVPWALDHRAMPPEINEPDEEVYLPGRNLALLTQAAILGYTIGAGRIQLGILSANPFPDATPEFFRSFEKTVFAAMRWPVKVETPLAEFGKSEVIFRGRDFPLSLTLSCVRPRGGIHCGRCNKCSERWRAFVKAGVSDPAPYACEIGD